MPWTRRSSSNRKEIVHIVVTGYHKKKEPRKHYVFVVDVTWNNSERYETYRRYSDFFSFQTTLKQLFPAAAGRRGDVRSIPQLPKRIFVGRSHVAKVAEARLEQINRYCQTLISLDPRISESAHVIGFFSPRIGDKQLPKLHLHRPASIHPKKAPISRSFEEYCALAEYIAEDTSQVSFKAGDKVVVMSKDDSGWWMCGVDGKVGWAPPSYLKKCTEKEDNEESDDSDDDFLSNTDSLLNQNSDDSGVGDNSPTTPNSSVEDQGFHVPEISAEEYKAIENYEADGPGQVSFEEGDTIVVLDKLEDGWWFVSNGQDEGWAPCSYLERMNGIDEEEETISSLDIEKYYSVDDYEAEEDDEISFPKGAVVDVLQKRLDGWWFVKHNENTGLAPATFLRKGLPPAKPELAVIMESETKDTNSLQVPNPDEEDSDDEFAYENVQFQDINKRAQPPRRESVRKNLSMRKGIKAKTSAFKPALPNIPARPAQHPTYTNYQPPNSPGSSDSEQENKAMKNKKKLSTLREDDEKEEVDFGQQNRGSLRAALAARGDVRNRIKAFEMTSGSESSISSTHSDETPPPPKTTIKPPIAAPRARIRNQSSVESPVMSQPQKEEKTRSKSTGTPPMLPLAARPPPPPRPNQAVLNKIIPKINEQFVDNSPSAGPTKSSSQTPPIQPPRPTLSVYQRAKDRSRSASPCMAKQKGRDKAGGSGDAESEDSDTNSVLSSRSKNSTPGKPRHKVKKTRSQSSADQLSVRPSPPTAPVRRKSTSESTDMFPPLESPPKNSVGQAIGEEDGTLNEAMAGTIIKYILASPDPKLKAALKDLITNDKGALDSLK